MRRRRMDGMPAQVIEKGRLRLDIVASLAFIFYPDGIMAANTDVEGHRLGADGAKK